MKDNEKVIGKYTFRFDHNSVRELNKLVFKLGKVLANMPVDSLEGKANVNIIQVLKEIFNNL